MSKFTVMVHRRRPGQRIIQIQAQGRREYCVAVEPNGRSYLTGSMDYAARRLRRFYVRRRKREVSTAMAVHIGLTTAGFPSPWEVVA